MKALRYLFMQYQDSIIQKVEDKCDDELGGTIREDLEYKANDKLGTEIGEFKFPIMGLD